MTTAARVLEAEVRQAVERAVATAPEPIVRMLSEVLSATEAPSEHRMVVIRFDRDGAPRAEVFARDDAPVVSQASLDLWEAFAAAEEPFNEALRRGRERRQALLTAEGELLSGADVASMLRLSRQAIDKRRRAGRLIGLSTGRRGYAYPSWQFSVDGLLPGLAEVLDDLPNDDPWSRMIFLLLPNIATDGERPLDSLRRGELEQVRRAAQLYLNHGAV